MRRIIKQVLIGLLLVILAGAAVLAWRIRPRTDEVYTDADRIRLPRDRAAIREMLWEPPQRPPDFVPLGPGDSHPTLSADGQLLVFVRDAPGMGADLYVRVRVAAGWTDARPIAAANSRYDELHPELSREGAALYFSSNRAGSVGGYDLWMSRRLPDDWSEPVNLGPRVNSPFDERFPAAAPEGDLLYFASNRPLHLSAQRDEQPDWSAVLDASRDPGDDDLYVCRRRGDGFTDVAALSELNTYANESAPAIALYGDFLYFASDRPGGSGGFDLYRARRFAEGAVASAAAETLGGFGDAENLGTTLNSPGDETEPETSLAAHSLLFRAGRSTLASGRPTQSASLQEGATGPDASSGQPVPGPENASSDGAAFRFSTSREVFREVQTRWPDLDWGELWRLLGSNVLWALLALILILLLLALQRDFRERGLSLLARCLVVSLLAHLVLMLLFNVWKVSTGLGDYARRRGEILVSLAAPSGGEAIAEQIRGSLTSVSLPAAEPLAAEPAPMEASINAELELASVETPAAVVHFVEERVIESATPEAANPASEPMVVPPTVVGQTTSQTLIERLPLPAAQAPSTAAEAAAPTPPSPAMLDSLPAPPGGALDGDAVSPPEVIVAAAAFDAAMDRRSALPGADFDAPDAAPPQRTASPLHPSVEAGGGVAMNSVDPLAELALPAVEAAMTDANESSPEPAAAPGLQSPPVARAEMHAPFGDSSAFVAETVAIGPAVVAPERNMVIEPPDDAVQPDAPAFDPRGPRLDAAAVAAAQPLTELALPNAPMVGDVPEAAEGVGSPVDLAGVPAPVRAELRAIDAPRDDHIGEEFAPIAAETEVDLPPAGIDERRFVEGEGRDAAVADAARSPPHARVAAVAEPPRFELGLPRELELPPQTPLPRGAIGLIEGRVTDAESGAPLKGAIVRIDLSGREAVSARADGKGRYQLAVPQVPDFFAVSASNRGYVPQSIGIPAARLGREPLTVDFELSPATEQVIALEDEPDVHHLGNDLFEGRINSQFQKPSEGRSLRASFELSEGQLSANYGRAEILLLAKGVQCPHQIRINGHLVRKRLAASPRDGGFGEFRAAFDPDWLGPGRNRLKITTTSCSGDLDDFEFVNVQIVLVP